MHLYRALAFAFAFTAVSAKAIDAQVYKDNFLSATLDRINNYITDHADSLTEKQEEILNKCLDIIENQDHSQLGEIRISVQAEFDAGEAAFILNGISGTTPDESAAKRDILRRARECSCSTDDNYCSDNHYCKYNHRGCKFNNGCGTFWLEECNGMCVKK